MTSTVPTTIPHQKRKLVSQRVGPPDKRTRPRGLTRAVRTAIDALMFERCSRAEACKKAGITERALYLALEKMEVARYWNQCLHVLRTGERARNLHRLCELREQDDNRNASVRAVQVLEQLDAVEQSRPGVFSAPGFIVVITPPAAQTGDAAPVIEHDAAQP